MSYVNELSNLSYTNKDFSQIYPELLDLVSKISYKWDPALSDESDPGVVLLKLAALMADKCNYNIDKNTLEQFPQSVTQLANARQLFDQCGYTMRYYKSATTRLKLRMMHEPDFTEDDLTTFLPDTTLELSDVLSDHENYPRHYTIPRFTMFSDVDNTSVFTSVEDVTVSSDGVSHYVDVIQGVVSALNVNGSEVITADVLDANNRLYLPSLNVPENGIFVNNVGSQSFFWESKDNLLIHPLGSRIFKFGLTQDGTRCFIEFPTDASSLIAEGVQIHYVTTSGYNGNIGKRLIKQFFTETKCTRTLASLTVSQELDITTDEIYIVNEDSTINGRDPESIEDAYRNYQKVKNTFETLVTTTDYSNYLQSSGRMSNCVVCDRSDDIQSSYKVLNTIDGVDQLIPMIKQSREYIEVEIDGESKTASHLEDEMTAFDLRVYGLQYVDGFKDYSDFSKSFELDSIEDKYDLSSIEDIKCIQHDYLKFEPNRIILLKNRYPITAKLISSTKLSYAQQDDIIANVKLALFQLLNSQKINFGDEIDYNTVYNTILNADSRINAIALDDISYETYAIYVDDSYEFRSLRIDANSKEPTSVYLAELWKQFRVDVFTRAVLEGKTPLFIKDTPFTKSLAHETATEKTTYTVDKITTETDIMMTLSDGDSPYYTSDKLHENDVITLTAPNLIMEERYANYVQYITNIGIGLKRTASDGSVVTRQAYRIGIETPEVVVPKNTDYVLQQDEYIIFFWRTSEDDSEPYTYIKYTGRDSDVPCIINPTFNILKQPHPQTLATSGSVEINDEFFMKLGDSQSTNHESIKLTVNEMYPVASSEGTVSTDLNKVIQTFIIGTPYFSVGQNTIEKKKLNKIHINNTQDGTKKVYWILNDTVESRGKLVYRLFSADSSDTVYTLKDGEQFIYSNDRGSQYYILGAGTRIERAFRSGASATAWECSALANKLDFLKEGPTYFESSEHEWFNIDTRAAKTELYATEMLYRKLGSGTKLRMLLPTGAKSTETQLTLNANGINIVNPEYKQLHLCSFIVIDEDGNSETLPNRNHTSLAWSVSASCNINMSVSAPQRLYGGQKFTWTDMDGVTTELAGSNTELIYIQSDKVAMYSGGMDVDVTTYDIVSDSSVPIELYVYKIRDFDMSSNVVDAKTLWEHTDTGKVRASGMDVSLSNIKLDGGDYIIPIEVDSINGELTVYWTEMRQISKHKLTNAEKNKMLSLEMVNAGVDANGASYDGSWVDAARPHELCDVAYWIYGAANIDVSRIFKRYSVSDAFNILFTREEGTTTYAVSDNPSDRMLADTCLLQLQDTSATPLTSTELTTRINELDGGVKVGDVICADIDYETVHAYDIWVCIDTNKFISVTRTADAGYDCECVDSIVFDTVADYAFLFRPQELAETEGSGIVATESLCENLTKTPATKNVVYYYAVKAETDSSYTLRISDAIPEGTTKKTSPTFTVHDLRKFKYPTLSDLHEDPIPFVEDILENIGVLDRTGRFNFLYEVPDADLVEYPLMSQAFLNPDHPMNKFTICQYTLPDSTKRDDIVVISKAR